MSKHSVEADANTISLNAAGAGAAALQVHAVWPYVSALARKAYEDAAQIIGLIEILEASNNGEINPALAQ